MAELGVRTIDELIGRSDLLLADEAVEHWKARGIDLSGILGFPEGVDPDAPRHQVRAQESVLDDNIDWGLIEKSRPALDDGEKVHFQSDVKNVDRCIGGILSNAIATKFGAEGLPEDTIQVDMRGAAGQSFGGWLAPGVSFALRGEVNDYAGKGLSGGIMSVAPPEGASYITEDNVVVGNTTLYGATKGRAFFRGIGGERFAVRNSGATAVVEGVGDHGCEYMTGGQVIVLGRTGRNFAAGMSGGLAYVYDDDGTFAERVNPNMTNQLEAPDESDLIYLQDVIAEHARRTDSPVAARMLEEWDYIGPKFVKVFPADYKRVLAELEEEEAGSDNGDAENFEAVGSVKKEL